MWSKDDSKVSVKVPREGSTQLSKHKSVWRGFEAVQEASVQ